MGRVLWIEAKVEDSINKLLGQLKFQVGLVVGQFADVKDFGIHFVRCPDPVDDDVEVELSSSDDEIVNSKKKKEMKNTNKTTATDDIDSQWVIEHSRQVNRMLGGGMSVMGIYIFCDNETLTKIQIKLKGCLVAIQKRLEKNHFIRKSFPHLERYLIHICSQSGKLTCRTIDLKEEQLSLKPVEYKYQNFLDTWGSVMATVDVSIEVPVPLEHSTAIEQKVIYACEKELADIWNSCAVMGFKKVNENDILFENKKKMKKGKKEARTTTNISLFKKVNSNNVNCKAIEARCSTDSLIKLIGALHSKAFVNNKATIGEAVLYLKVDIIRSILTRVELLCEEAQVNNLDQVEEWSLVSPVRVFTPHVTKSLLFSDYVFKDECPDDVIGRFSDLLNITPKEEDLNYSEHSPDVAEVSVILHSDKQSDLHSDIASELSSSCHEESRDKKIYFAGIAAGFLAMLAALFKFAWNE